MNVNWPSLLRFGGIVQLESEWIENKAQVKAPAQPHGLNAGQRDHADRSSVLPIWDGDVGICAPRQIVPSSPGRSIDRLRRHSPFHL